MYMIIRMILFLASALLIRRSFFQEENIFKAVTAKQLNYSLQVFLLFLFLLLKVIC